MTRSLDTRLVHAGAADSPPEGAVVTPIFQSAMYRHRGEGDELGYVRYGNTPNQRAVGRALASAEGGGDAAVAASGMSAVTGALLAVLSEGDRLLAQRSLYGGTRDLLDDVLPRLGIGVDLVAGDDPDAWEEAVGPATGALYLESISNPLMEVPRLEEAVAFASGRDLVSLVDNTFATPVNVRPLELGFDLSIHSATKYLNGHSDIVAGAVVGGSDLVDRVRRRLTQTGGGALDPHACFLLQRGMKTLPLRVERQNATALRLARELDAHPAVDRVHHPGLEGSPGHERARRLFDGYGGMLAFEPAGGAAAARRLIEALEIPLPAPSLGGVESLVTRPAASSHASVPREEREAQGITDGLVRMSVGVEGADDLAADLRRGLEAAGGARG